MEIAIAREDVVDLEKIVGRNVEHGDQRGLNGFRHLYETGVIILPLQHVDLGKRHVPVPLSTASMRRWTDCFGNVCRRHGSGKRNSAKLTGDRLSLPRPSVCGVSQLRTPLGFALDTPVNLNATGQACPETC